MNADSKIYLGKNNKSLENNNLERAWGAISKAKARNTFLKNPTTLSNHYSEAVWLMNIIKTLCILFIIESL